MTKPLIINAAPQTADDLATIRKWTGADPKPKVSVVEAVRPSVKTAPTFPWAFAALTVAAFLVTFVVGVVVI